MSNQYAVITIDMNLCSCGWECSHPSIEFSNAEIYCVTDNLDEAIAERHRVGNQCGNDVFAFILTLTDTGWKLVKEES